MVDVIETYLAERRVRTEKFSEDGNHFICESGILYPIQASGEPTRTLREIFGDETFNEAKALLSKSLRAGSVT